MANNSKTYFVFNERSILISYNHSINSKLISNLSNTRKTIETHLNDCIIEVVQSINSLLIIFDINKISANDLIKDLKRIEDMEDDLSESNKTWQIPVCYDLKFAIDLENFAKEKNYLHQKLLIFTNQNFMMFCQWDFYLVSCIWVLLIRIFTVKERKFRL